MIRTKEYIVVKKYGSKWIPAKELNNIEVYSFKDAQEVLSDMKNGNIPGHSKKAKYRILEVCYCNLEIN